MFGVLGQHLGGAARRPRRDTPAWQARPASMSEAAWRAAKVLSGLANPMVLCPPCFLAVACKATPRWPDRLRWWALSCGLITLAPVIHIRWGLRTGRLSDPEITVRQERLIPYAAQIGTLGVTYALLRRLHAPRLIIAVVISVAGAIVVITGVTTVWKMSMHLVGTAGTATVLTLIYGKRALPLVGLIPLVAWSRYVLDHHTPAQAFAGAALGAAAPLIVFHRMDPLHLARHPPSDHVDAGGVAGLSATSSPPFGSTPPLPGGKEGAGPAPPAWSWRRSRGSPRPCVPALCRRPFPPPRGGPRVDRGARPGDP